MLRNLFIAVAAVALVATAPAAAQAQSSSKASFVVNADKAKVGQKLFNSRGCFGCHTIGKGKLAGPDLAGILDRRDTDWLSRWLSNTAEMLDSDPTAKELLKEYKGFRMPNVKLTATEIDAVLNYIAVQTEKVGKK
jgi:mono/diheme cytochrome c family protein